MAVKTALKLLFAYIVLCCAIPPLLAKRKGAGEAQAGDDAGLYAAAEGAGERVLSIDGNDAALLWRLRLIAAAEKEIVLSTFDFRADESGKDVMAALLDAGTRGVDVKILVDGLYGLGHLKHRSHFRALASAPNVEVRFYNQPRLWTLWRVNYRMHDKYLVCDGRAYLLGGRNVHDKFLGAYGEAHNADRDVLVCEAGARGSSSLDAVRAYFGEVWALPCCKTVSVFAKKSRALSRARGELRERWDTLKRSRPVCVPPERWLDGTMETERVALLTNPIRAWNKSPALWQSLCLRMRGAERVDLQTPYVVCSRAMYRDIQALAETGVALRIFTNSAENGANVFGSADFLNEERYLRRAGAAVYAVSGGRPLHTKAVLIDGKTSVVGSFNADMRSAYLDTETMLAIDSPALAAYLAAQLASLPESCRDVPEKGRRYPILRVLTVPFRYLL